MKTTLKKVLATTLAVLAIAGTVAVASPVEVSAESWPTKSKITRVVYNKKRAKKICMDKKQIRVKIVNKRSIKTKLKLHNVKSKNAKKIKWSTSNKNMATVNKRGQVTIKGGKSGKVTIYAKYKRKTYKCQIIIQNYDGGKVGTPGPPGEGAPPPREGGSGGEVIIPD